MHEPSGRRKAAEAGIDLTSSDNPYAPPSTVDVPRSKELPWPIVGAAGALCAGAAYLQFPWRGSLFCLLPGVASRSVATATKGALLGLTADFLISMFWVIFTRAWDPRFGGYNDLLATRLPPDINVATHVNSPFANWFIFGGGLSIWMAFMFAVWTSLWKAEMQTRQLLRLQIIGFLLGAGTAAILWNTAWIEGRLVYFRDINTPTPHPPSIFLPLFFSLLPLDGFVMACLIHREANRLTGVDK